MQKLTIRRREGIVSYESADKDEEHFPSIFFVITNELDLGIGVSCNRNLGILIHRNQKPFKQIQDI